MLDFLKVFLKQVLNIEIMNRTETKKKEEFALKVNGKSKNSESDKSQSEVDLISSQSFVACEDDH